MTPEQARKLSDALQRMEGAYQQLVVGSSSDDDEMLAAAGTEYMSALEAREDALREITKPE